MLDPITGKGIMTSGVKPGIDMAIVGVPAHKRLRACLKNKVAQEAFSPARFGFSEIQYRPIEELIEN